MYIFDHKNINTVSLTKPNQTSTFNNNKDCTNKVKNNIRVIYVLQTKKEKIR